MMRRKIPWSRRVSEAHINGRHFTGLIHRASVHEEEVILSLDVILVLSATVY